MKKHVTIRDVAKITGVSTKTVSRVVNNQGEISEATRQRVKAAIENLGYFPNITARNLVQGRSNTIAVIAWGIEYFGPSRVVVGIEQQADQFGYSLLLTLLRAREMDQIGATLRALTARRVDGIIFAIPEFNHNRDWINESILLQLPPIVFLNMESHPGLAIVAIDNKDGAKLATQHLVDQGRKNIGLITGPMNWWEAQQRYLGWKEVLERAGLSASAGLVSEGDWSASSGERAMQSLFDTSPTLDAVFASNDQMALGALGVIYQMGKRVPHDIAVVGFDNIPDSSHFWPPLTTIHQPLTDVGRSGVQVLNQLISASRDNIDGIELPITTLKPELVVRQSTILTDY